MVGIVVIVGEIVGPTLGIIEGSGVGDKEGVTDGHKVVGSGVGNWDGIVDEVVVGRRLGLGDGELVGFDGNIVDAQVGFWVGLLEGLLLIVGITIINWRDFWWNILSCFSTTKFLFLLSNENMILSCRI